MASPPPTLQPAPHPSPPPTLALPLSSTPPARVRSSPTGDTPRCTECGKRFLSWKALFGHMRCHPERQWRGITPPTHFRHGAGGGTASATTGQFTVQEREVAASLLMLAGAGKDKKSLLESCGTPTARRYDGHKCGVCDRGFASGQALGRHKRCHWDRACAEAAAVATSGGCSGLATSETATVLDLNLPPPEPPLPRMSDQGSDLNTMLELKLGN